LKNYSRNLMPFLADLEPDEAGMDPAEVSKRYGLALDQILVLSRNENPYGPSPKVCEALKHVPMNRYPGPEPFLDALSRYTGYPKENIVAGAGMDEVITIMSRLFLGSEDKVLIPIPTYTFYSLVVKICGANPVYQQRLENFEVDPEIPEGLKLIFLCSPNNPTGNALSEKTVRRIAESTQAIVFLDEAYAEFADWSLLGLVKEYENIVVGRTLSKAFGLAGLRLGYAVAPEWIAEQYRRISPLFSISGLSLAAGVAALEDAEYMHRTVSKIIDERERLKRCLEGAHPSQGNFLYIHTQGKSGLVVERLLSRGVIVRDCATYPGAAGHCIRVTVGTPKQNDRFMEAFDWADGLGSS
jgi:histidinol-phosphate aminotransferase